MTRFQFVTLADAEPAEAVVVVDVLRAFTVEPWLLARGARRVLSVATPDHAFALRDAHLPGAVLVGEHGGRPIDGFDHGNSPSEIAGADLTAATVVHRSSAGTQGLDRTVGSGLVLAAAFVTAGATARFLRASRPAEVTFVVTGASLGRDGDEDLAAAELIAARIQGDEPEVTPFLRRVAASDAGRSFVAGGLSWAPPEDLALACEVDHFDHAMLATEVDGLGAIEIRRR